MCVTCRQLSEAQVLHGSRGDQRFLRVVQHVSQRVHPNVEVGDVDSHGLLPHSRLVRVPGGLDMTAKALNVKGHSCSLGKTEKQRSTFLRQ